MGNVCGGTKALNDHPTHHRLGSVSDTPRPPTQGNNGAPAQVPVAKPRPTKSSAPAVDANGAEERERRLKAAEERAKAVSTYPVFRCCTVADYRVQAAARGTVASNPKHGQLAAQLNKPVDRTNNNGREEEPLRVS